MSQKQILPFWFNRGPRVPVFHGNQNRKRKCEGKYQSNFQKENLTTKIDFL